MAAYTFGYDRDVDLVPHVRTAFGAQVTAYGVPEICGGIMVRIRWGLNVFVRMRPFSGEER